MKTDSFRERTRWSLARVRVSGVRSPSPWLGKALALFSQAGESRSLNRRAGRSIRMGVIGWPSRVMQRMKKVCGL